MSTPLQHQIWGEAHDAIEDVASSKVGVTSRPLSYGATDEEGTDSSTGPSIPKNITPYQRDDIANDETHVTEDDPISQEQGDCWTLNYVYEQLVLNYNLPKIKESTYESHY